MGSSHFDTRGARWDGNLECGDWYQPFGGDLAREDGSGCSPLGWDGRGLGTSTICLKPVFMRLLTGQLYLLVLPLHRPLTTPPWSAVLVYILLTVGGVTQIGMRSYVKTVTGHHPYWATGLWLGLQIYQTVGAIFALSILARLYLAAPAVLSRLVRTALDPSSALTA